LGHDEGLRGPNQRQRSDQQGDAQDLPTVRRKVAQNALQQLAVAVLAIVRLGVQASEKAHRLFLIPRENRPIRRRCLQ
jgi:hypothetical protein